MLLTCVLTVGSSTNSSFAIWALVKLPRSCGWGNLDTRLVRPGAAVAFRVHQAGLGLAAGDLHAAMGDGELGGTGIGIAGRVQLSVEPFAGHEGIWPLLFADDAVYVLAGAADVGSAVRAGFGEAVELVARGHGLAWPDAYRLTSVVADVQISQLVNPRVTVRVRVPRQWCPEAWSLAWASP
jgi:amidase